MKIVQMIVFFLVFLCLVHYVDAKHEKKLYHYYVPGEDVQGIDFLDCDGKNPLNCKRIDVHYTRGTEQLIVIGNPK